MTAKKYPDFTFETGYRALVVRTSAAGGECLVEQSDYVIVGKLESGTPFKLEYNGGVTNWSCAEALGEGLRRKILERLRREVRFADALPVYMESHDLRLIFANDVAAARDAYHGLYMSFHNEVWRAKYLNDRDEDYVVLGVPYAEKDAVKALGARFDGTLRKWKVKKQSDMAAFANWLPA